MTQLTVHPQQHVVIYDGQTNLVLTGLGSGSSVEQREWTGAPNQQWIIENTNGRIRNVDTGLCLDVSGVSHDEGAAVITWADNGGDNQRWEIQTLEGGGCRLLVGHSGQALSAPSPAAPPVQRRWSKADGQRWEIGAVLHDNQRIALRSDHGKQLSASPTGTLTNVVAHIKSWEGFVLDRIGGVEDRALSYGDQVSLQTHHQTYLSAKPDGGLVATAVEVDSWETFTVTRTDGSTEPGPVLMDEAIALRGAHGKWVRAADDGAVTASAPVPQSWEHWRPTPTEGYPLTFEHVRWVEADEDLQIFLVMVRCIRPAVGIEVDIADFFSNVGSWAAELGVELMFNGEVKAGLFVAAIGGAIGGGAELAKWIDSDRDQDDFYIRKGSKIWPSGADYHPLEGGEGVDLNFVIPFSGTLSLELMDYDSGSGDDVLGELRVDATGMELVQDGSEVFTAYVGSQAEDSLYELVYMIIGN
ncbi:Extracellular exo-alpha-L-arabinofuranosidase precursor [Enhygromyxa salina]|uniref:Extracellular exo-alpha-L-arabinofuranosidase n=1 Tax=Enhygromyxa salina TaxID=215803 RepID=A0A2S9XFD6_9BACT|nr:RICIN domain-containing protein [Enhygromyxa salina]PRP91391.1 Extracellular exo-alpha-L-arabinofuranosidase precursor [Enhygromyxa salina]